MKNKLTFAFISFFLFCSFSLQAQQKEWTGQVFDDKLNEPLIGVSVSVKGTSTGTITDVNGKFTIKAANSQTLVFSYIGYNSTELILAPEINLARVIMKESLKELDEVVVVGYGVQTKASSVGSITTTKGDDLLRVGSVTSVSEAIQGQMPGVISISYTSKPGADAADIFIRGKSTWGNASPLILVDGLERDFNDVDVNEIETISVLKDASATAVYGVKGANGVILITTKRGANKKTEVSLTANFGFKQPSAAPSWADYPTSMKMFNEAKANDKGWDGLIRESTISAWENAIAGGNYGPYNEIFPQVDWWAETVRDAGYQQNYNINVSGGTEKMKYFTSVGYLDDGDIYKSFKNDKFDPSFNYKRYNWRSNFDFQLTKTTLLSLNIAGKMGYRNQPAFRAVTGAPDDDSWFFKFYYENSYNSFPIKYSDGEWGAGSTGEGNLMLFLSETGSKMNKSYQGFYDVKLEQDLKFITEGLTMKGSLSYTSSSAWESTIMRGMVMGMDELNAINTNIRYYREYDYSNPILLPDGTITYNRITNQRFQNEISVGNYPVGGSYDVFAGYSRKLYYELALNYKRNFGDHKVSGLVLVNRKNEEYTQGGGLDYPVLEEDWVSRATYGYKDKYLFEMNGAYTGSEKFAPGKRFGFFSSYSLGWRASEEVWVKRLTGKNLSNLKFRYSYGTVGNDKGAPRFNYIQSFDNYPTYAGLATFGLYQNYVWSPLYKEGKLADVNATWEKSIKQNLGIEIGLWNKLNISLDLFDEQRSQILMTRNTIPSWLSSGVSLPAVNLGEVKNHGFEIDANWNDKIGKFNYYIKLNFAVSENRVVYRDDPYALPDYMKQAGKPIGYQDKYIATGNFQSLDDIYNSAQSQIPGGLHNTLIPGDLYYIDYNGDGIISPNDRSPHAYVNYPMTTGGLTIGGDWNGIGFNALFYSAMDVYKEQISNYLWDFPTGNIKAQPNTLDRWTSDKPIQSGPVRPSVHVNNTYNSLGSSYTYVSHAYLRLKNLEINYAIPSKWLKFVNVTRCQVYVNGNNIFTISSVDSRRDPETGGQNVYPIIKRYNVGFRLGF